MTRLSQDDIRSSCFYLSRGTRRLVVVSVVVVVVSHAVFVGGEGVTHLVMLLAVMIYLMCSYEATLMIAMPEDADILLESTTVEQQDLLSQSNTEHHTS